MRGASFMVSDASEKQHRIMYTDVSTGQPIPFCKGDGLRLSSTGAPWADVLKMEEHRVLPQETAESSARAHHLAMRLGPPGKVEWRITGERARCGVVVPGDLHLISQGVPRWGRWYQPAALLLVALEPRFVAAVANQCVQADHITFTNRCAFRDPALTHLLLALRAELQAGCPTGRLYGESLATALALHLLQRYTVCPSTDGDPRGGLPPARLHRALDYMHAHLGEELSLRQLAAVVQLSPHHFAARFKQSTGVAPYQYVLRQRIATAQHLLAETHLSLAEVAYRLGFSSQAHFTTMFRQHIGTTPGAYRQGS
jgi:AraC family transcriptional regulator